MRKYLESFKRYRVEFFNVCNGHWERYETVENYDVALNHYFQAWSIYGSRRVKLILG